MLHFFLCLFCSVLPFGCLVSLCACFVGDCLLAGSSHGASPVFGDPGSSFGVALISSYLGHWSKKIPVCLFSSMFFFVKEFHRLEK